MSGFIRGLNLEQDHPLNEQDEEGKGKYKGLGAAKRLTLARSHLNLGDCSSRPTFSFRNRAFPVNDPNKFENCWWWWRNARYYDEAASIQSHVSVATIFKYFVREIRISSRLESVICSVLRKVHLGTVFQALKSGEWISAHTLTNRDLHVRSFDKPLVA